MSTTGAITVSDVLALPQVKGHLSLQREIVRRAVHKLWIMYDLAGNKALHRSEFDVLIAAYKAGVLDEFLGSDIGRDAGLGRTSEPL